MRHTRDGKEDDMPYGDGTGPLGQGPMTGRGRGMGFGRGRGCGLGICRRAIADDPATLATQIDRVESVLTTLKQRLTTSKTGQA